MLLHHPHNSHSNISNLHSSKQPFTMGFVRCNGCAQQKDCTPYSGIVVQDTTVTRMYCDDCAKAKGYKW